MMNKTLLMGFIASLCISGTAFAEPAMDPGATPPPPPAGGPPHGPGGGPHHGGPHGPPKEAMEACTGKTEGTACSFVTPKKDTINGTCSKPPHGPAEELHCKPEHPPKKK